MSELLVNTIKKADGTGSLAIPAESGTVVTTASPSLGRRNLIINGGQVIDQRNGGGSVNTANAVVYVTDRWFFIENSSETATTQQVTDAPDGFTHSFKFTNSATPTTPSYGQLVQNIEGYNVAHLDYGTASAKTVTVSFWVKASVTGNYSICLRNGASNRSIVSTYTINSANTWEYKTVTFIGDTTGTWAKDNTTGLSLIYRIAGSGGTTTLDSWVAGDVFASGAVNIMGTASATWQITGVQLEVGSVATPFEHRSYGEELTLCQRYYVECYYGTVLCGYQNGTSQVLGTYPTATVLRAQPSVEYKTGTISVSTPSSPDFNSYSITGAGIASFEPNNTMITASWNLSGWSGNDDDACFIWANNRMAFDAEL